MPLTGKDGPVTPASTPRASALIPTCSCTLVQVYADACTCMHMLCVRCVQVCVPRSAGGGQRAISGVSGPHLPLGLSQGLLPARTDQSSWPHASEMTLSPTLPCLLLAIGTPRWQTCITTSGSELRSSCLPVKPYNEPSPLPRSFLYWWLFACPPAGKLSRGLFGGHGEAPSPSAPSHNLGRNPSVSGKQV